MVAKTLAVLLFVALTACVTPKGTFCDIARPIRLSAEVIAAMSDAEVEAALAHNRKGAKLCRWIP